MDDKTIGDIVFDLLENVESVSVFRLPVATRVDIHFTWDTGVTFADLTNLADVFGDRFTVETHQTGGQNLLRLRFLGGTVSTDAWKIRWTCCGKLGLMNEYYDSRYCGVCFRWLEAQCSCKSEHECPYSVDSVGVRPETAKGARESE